MTTLREQAKAYEPKETKNVTELEKVPVDVEMKDVEYTTKEGKAFTVHEIEVMNETYRVPTTVIKQLKAQLEAKPEAEFFKVTSTGSGLGTEYTVIIL